MNTLNTRTTVKSNICNIHSLVFTCSYIPLSLQFHCVEESQSLTFLRTVVTVSIVKSKEICLSHISVQNMLLSAINRYVVQPAVTLQSALAFACAQPLTETKPAAGRIRTSNM